MKVLDSGAIVGTTPELRRLADTGHVIKSAWNDFELLYLPRTPHDPKPWVTHGSPDGFRFNARECYAEAKPEPASDEPTLEDYAQAGRIVQSLIPRGRNVR